MLAQGVETVGHAVGFNVDEGVLLDNAERILDQAAVVFAEVGPFLSGWASVSKFGGQSRENRDDVICEDPEFGSYLRPYSWHEARLDRQHGVKKAVGAGEHACQKRDFFSARPRFALHAIDGRERVGAGEAGCETEMVEVEWRDAANTFQIFHDAGEVNAI